MREARRAEIMVIRQIAMMLSPLGRYYYLVINQKAKM